MRAVLERLGELAEDAGRPAAREILQSAMVPGTPGPAAGLATSTEPLSPGWRGGNDPPTGGRPPYPGSGRSPCRA